MSTISVLIVNYNTEQEVKRAIESVLCQRDIEVELYVIDNASADGSAAVLQSFSEHIHLTLSKENLGFGKANNLLFQQVTTPYIYLMNPDAWFEDERALTKLVHFMAQHPQYGIVGTTMMDENHQKMTPPVYAYPTQRHLRQPLPALPGDIAWVLGASMGIPTAIFREVNGFDEHFFLYGEDTDLCLRVRMAGYAIGLAEEVTVQHIGSASEKYEGIYARQVKKNRALYQFYRKHYHHKDVKRLVNRASCRAHFRAYSYYLAFILTRKAHYQRRYEYCRAVIDTARQFLRPPQDN